MYNNTNTDVKVPVKVSSQLGNHGKQTKGTCTFMTYVVQFGFLFYVCGVASYWMINFYLHLQTKEEREEN